jgi:hypothetical protein
MTVRRNVLFRLPAIDLGSRTSPLEGYCGLVVENGLAAPIFVTFDGSPPGPDNYDLACPGNGLRTHPIQGVTQLTATVYYPGAVPAGDAGLSAIFTVVDRDMGATVGPLA